MGDKKLFPKNNIIMNGVMAGTATLNSTVIPCSNGDNFGFELNWTGTPVGMFTVFVSNTGINFAVLPFNPPLEAPSGVPDTFGINVFNVPFAFIYISYTNISGAGVLNVWSLGKDLN
jgi:hypothetical protein